MFFLTETSALATIARVIAKAPRVRLAVAFWGLGAIDRLGLDRKGLEIEVLCNLDSGACNPAEISRLIGLKAKVRSNPRLHGKVYWTPDAVIIGSSNASSNGLVVEGADSAGWSEANILSFDVTMIQASGEWIKQQWDAGYNIEQKHLSAASALWASRKRAAPPGARLEQSLLNAFNAAPDHVAWKQVKVAVWSKDLSARATHELKDFQVRDVAFSKYGAYEQWHDDLESGDWLIDFDLSSPKPQLSGYWRVPTPKLETDNLTYVQPAGGIRLPGLPPLRLSAADQRRFISIAPHLVEGHDGSRIVSLAEAVRLLEKHNVGAAAASPLPPQERLNAFHRAMLDIHLFARGSGYRDYAFKGRVDDYGGWNLAKQILLTEAGARRLLHLYKRGRPDLSVEALVQQPEWRDLFSPDELRVAAERYPLPKSGSDIPMASLKFRPRAPSRRR